VAYKISLNLINKDENKLPKIKKRYRYILLGIVIIVALPFLLLELYQYNRRNPALLPPFTEYPNVKAVLIIPTISDNWWIGCTDGYNIKTQRAFSTTDSPTQVLDFYDQAATNKKNPLKIAGRANAIKELTAHLYCFSQANLRQSIIPINGVAILDPNDDNDSYKIQALFPNVPSNQTVVMLFQGLSPDGLGG
jgi:hypothetical protein